jgi:hypothetical protein
MAGKASGGDDSGMLWIAVITVIVSAVAFFMVSGTFKDIRLSPATGEEGTAQVEVIVNAKIDLTFTLIDFLSGYVNPGAGSVVLTSDSGAAITDWLDIGGTPITVLDRGFVIENIGNSDLDIDTQLETDMDTWLPPGLTTISATLDYKIRNCDTTAPIVADADCSYTTQFDAVADTDPACTTFNVGTPADTYEPIAVSPAIDDSCDLFESENTKDEMRLDVRLTLPEDILPTGGVVTNRVILDIDAV